MKKRLLLSGAILAGTFAIYTLSNPKTEVEKVREKHMAFVKNHPYSKSSSLTSKERRAQGLPPNAFFEQEYLSEINPYTGKTYKQNVYKLQEELNAQRALQRTPGDGNDNRWIERGSNNVGGRTRAVIFDPNDETGETVIAGGVGGGLWKNSNISNPNSSWRQLGVPENLAVSSIAVDPNNTQIIYVGTGESYVNGDVNGNGLWRTTDGGNTWSNVLSGPSGDSYLDANAQLTVNSPAAIAGNYIAIRATAFGGELAAPLTGNLVLVNDGTETTDDGCEAIVNASAVNGNIAVIRRGGCNFDDKVLNAQQAGAIGVVMINNSNGNPISMGGDDTNVTIPAVMIYEADGESMLNQLNSGTTVNVTLTETNPDGANTNVVPGISHINDLLVRDNNGTTEIFVAAGDAAYRASNPLDGMGSKSFGVYKSTDGTNFTKLNLPKTADGNDYEPNNIEAGPNNTIYVSTIKSFTHNDGGGTILKSTDGTNFNVIHTIADGNRTELAVSKTTPGLVYVLLQTTTSGEPVRILKTPNDFIFTVKQNLPNDVDSGVPANDFTRGQSGYDLLIKLDPNDDNVVYTGGIDLFKTTSGSSSWSQISRWNSGISGNSSIVHSDQHGMAFFNGSSTRMVFSNDGGIYFSNDGGNTIEARNNNYNTLQFYTVGVAPTTAFDGDYFIAGAQDNGTQLFENAPEQPASSTEAQGGDGAYSFFDQDGTDKYYIANYVYNASINLYDYNTGNSRTIDNDSNSDSNGDFINQEVLDSNFDILYSNYSKDDNYIIRRYSNLKSGSVNRVNLTNDLMDAEPSAFAVSPHTTNASNLLAGLKNGKLLKIDNANVFHTWTDITGPGFVGSISDVEFGETEQDIFVTMHNYGVVSIWYTNDGGSTWQNKEGDFPDIPVKAILQNPLNLNEVIIGTDLGVWKTGNFNDASPTWSQSYNGMSNVKVTDLDLRNDNSVFASTYGRGVFSGKFTSETASVDEVLQGNKAFTVYPAISNGDFKIFAKNTSGKTKMFMYNLNGQEVYRTNLDFNANQEQSVSVNVKSGVYIVNIIDENHKKSSKKIVIK